MSTQTTNVNEKTADVVKLKQRVLNNDPARLAVEPATAVKIDESGKMSYNSAAFDGKIQKVRLFNDGKGNPVFAVNGHYAQLWNGETCYEDHMD